MSTAAQPLYRPNEALPEEERLTSEAAAGAEYERLLRRLAEQSVTKHFDAYADIAWDVPEFAVDPLDPRWELSDQDPLGGTAWYRAQPQAVRSGIGLQLTAGAMKTGLQFESVLKRGLLKFAETLPNRAPEFRYVYHEVIEEAQHALMFQEFVNRSGFDPAGLRPWMRLAAGAVVSAASRFPELFFVFVLGGEDPIDHIQRWALRNKETMHPLVRRISQIHVTEEARHLAFARQFLRRRVPRLSAPARLHLSLAAPNILGRMAMMMMRPSGDVVRRWGVPREVLAEAYVGNPKARLARLNATEKVRALCVELGLTTPLARRIWKVWGLWPTPAEAAEFGYRIA